MPSLPPLGDPRPNPPLPRVPWGLRRSSVPTAARTAAPVGTHPPSPAGESAPPSSTSAAPEPATVAETASIQPEIKEGFSADGGERVVR